MEKGYPPQEAAPPYPGPPLNYGGTGPQPDMYPQPGMYPQPAMYPQPGVPPAAPPPAGYQGGVPYAPGTVAPITTVTQVVITPILRDFPGQALCQHCHQNVTTQTNHTSGAMAWTICAVLAIFGCWPCCCIPFCVESCQDVEHRCPSCNRVIYIYRRM